MQGLVELSSDPLIDYLDFCRAIAEAVCPTGEKGLRGIECVIGKVVTHHVPIPESAGPPVSSPFYHAWQSVLVSEDGRTLNQLLPSDQVLIVDGRECELPFSEAVPRQIGELSLPYALSDADRQNLANVLPSLPPLRYPMSEEERAAFTEAYFNMPNRPMWVPDLVTERTIERRKAGQDAELMRIQQVLRQELEAGRLTPVNASHAPVATLMAGTFIPRAQAIAYLERHGLTHRAPDAGRSDAATEKHQDHAGQSNSKWRPGQPKLTPDQRQALFEYHEGLVGKDRAHVKKTSEKFGVSRKEVYLVIKEMRLAQKEGRIDQILVAPHLGNVDSLPT